VLQCVAVCRSVLRWDVVDCVAACSVADHECGLQCVAVYCGELLCVESAAAVYAVPDQVCVCCSVFQCVAVCCSVLQWDVVDSHVAGQECGLQ